jgi:sugar lactone lactonase YvrE
MESFKQVVRGQGSALRVRLTISGVLIALVSGVLGLGSSASIAAEAPAALWTRCAAGSEEDISCEIPRGIAASPNSGHVFVTDSFNFRIGEFTALGTLVRTWGSEGSGAGQFGAFGPQGVAVDSIGNVYVVDFSNRRVEKFDPAGNFVLMFGGEVNKTKSEEAGSTEAERNLCTAASGNECQAGVEGAGNGEFGQWRIGGFITIDTRGTESVADDRIYVGDQERIERFDAAGVYQESITTGLSGDTVQSLAVDAAGNLYTAFTNAGGGHLLDIHKMTAAGAPLPPTFELDDPEGNPVAPTAVALDPAGNVYAFGPTTYSGGKTMDPIFEFNPEGKLIANFGKGEFSTSTGLATNLCPGGPSLGNLYVTNAAAAPNGFLRAYGPEPTTCGKAITGNVSQITETSATLNGEANPKGQPVSECFFEYGTTRSYGETASCAESAGEIGSGNGPVPVHADIAGLTGGTVYHVRLVVGTAGGTEAGSDKTFKTLGPPVISHDHVASVAFTGATLKALVNPEGFSASYRFEYGLSTSYGHTTAEIPIGSDRSDHAAIANVEGLTPGTTYHWRIVATNSAVLRGGITEGEDHTFTTYMIPTPEPRCANKAFRNGPSALLPDCRAYEMVSPVDKNGGDIVHLGYVQASSDGERITYGSTPTFADEPASLLVNQYLAQRQAGQGWVNHGIHPPLGNRKSLPEILFGLSREFEAFSPDLCSAWFEDTLEPALTPDGQDGYANIYRRENCGEGAGSYEAVTTAEPPAGSPIFYVDIFAHSIAGYSDDGQHAVFAARAALLPEARVFGSGSQLQCASKAPGTISYKWLRNGAPIPGATAAAYTTVAADKGKAIQCQATALTASSGSTQVANPVIVIAPAPAILSPVAPRAIPAPAQSAPLLVGGGGGQTLTCEPEGGGSWEGSPSFAYQWYRNGVEIGGATASNYVVSAGDLVSAAVFQCAVTGTNAGGSATEVSANRVTSPEPTGPAPPNVDATMPTNAQVYDSFEGALRLVSVLPNGNPDSKGDGVGSSPGYNLQHAVSSDGSRIYWSAGLVEATGLGKLFLREHPEQEQSTIVAGECTEAAKACTVPVSSSNIAFFWAAAADGSKALYSEGEDLFEFDLKEAEEGQPPHLIAHQVTGVAGTSDDLSRVYFVSNEALTGTEQNSEGSEAQAGQPNLYLEEGGAITFVATLLPGDVGRGAHAGEESRAYVVDAEIPFRRPTRVSADGRRIAFESRARLTGYDNTDAENDEADVEVFTYEAGGPLECASCHPGGASPTGQELREPFRPGSLSRATSVFAAAWLQTWESPLYASHELSEDGGRLFFHSYEALVPRDTNGAMDVYEWEEPGEGSCTEESAAFHQSNGGCIFLISSGESPSESEFWDASPDGRNVFFSTESSLVGKDPGQVDLYDAREGGGFAEPTAKAACEGEACQNPPPPPIDQTPASAGYHGPGNAGEAKPRCAKGKHEVHRKGKVRCVKGRGHKQHKSAKRRANHKRRAGR